MGTRRQRHKPRGMGRPEARRRRAKAMSGGSIGRDWIRFGPIWWIVGRCDSGCIRTNFHQCLPKADGRKNNFCGPSPADESQ
jgi:hypothetical protein